MSSRSPPFNPKAASAGAGTSGQHLDADALPWASQPLSAPLPPRPPSCGLQGSSCTLSALRRFDSPFAPPRHISWPLTAVQNPTPNFFPGFRTRNPPGSGCSSSGGQDRGGGGVRACRDPGCRDQGCRVWDARTGMRGLGCGMQGWEDRDAHTRDVGCRDRDVGCRDQGSGYQCPAPYRAMKVGPSEGLQRLPGIAGLPMCSLNIHRGVSPPKLV